MIHDWHNFRKWTVNAWSAIVFLTAVLCKDLLAELLLCMSNTRWHCWHKIKKTTTPHQGVSQTLLFYNFLDKFWITDLFSVSSLGTASAESCRKEAEGLAGTLNDHCLGRSKSGLKRGLISLSGGYRGLGLPQGSRCKEARCSFGELSCFSPPTPTPVSSANEPTTIRGGDFAEVISNWL